ncbi:hypothetical protein D3C81_2061230 [compost metagenome]
MVKQADVETGGGVGVLVAQLTIGAFHQAQHTVVHRDFGAEIAIDQARADADG